MGQSTLHQKSSNPKCNTPTCETLRVALVHCNCQSKAAFSRRRQRWSFQNFRKNSVCITNKDNHTIKSNFIL